MDWKKLAGWGSAALVVVLVGVSLGAFGMVLIAISAIACDAWDSVPFIGDCEQIAFGSVPTCDEPPAPVPANASEFVEMYGQYAYDIGEEYGIPYDAILAQAALESGWGASSLTTDAYNFFGIKAGDDWDGPIMTVETDEQDENGNVYTVVADFRKYRNATEGFQGYADFIHDNSRYAEALNYPNDPVRYLTEVREAGYATDVNYVEKVVGILEQIQQIISDADMFPPSTEASSVVPASADANAPPGDSHTEPTGGSDAGPTAAPAAATATSSAATEAPDEHVHPEPTAVEATGSGEDVPEHTGPFSLPVAEGTPVTDIWAPNGEGGHRVHHGLDFGAPLGDPILAAADGVVTFAQSYDPDGYGSMIRIMHNIDGELVETWYAHMPDPNEEVQEGDTVEAGERIASIGEAGNSRGAHLHFEVHPVGEQANGGTIDPAVWLEDHNAEGTATTEDSCGGNGDVSGVTPPEKDSNGNWPPETCSVKPDPTTGANCVTPRTATAAEMVEAWGMPANTIACFSHRTSGEHPLGRACDLTMGAIGTRAEGADKATGDNLAEFLEANAETWAIEYVIWYGKIWSVARADEGWRDYTRFTDTTGGHYDHIHITVY